MEKHITKIEFENYKAFYGKGSDNTINIPYGKNVLIYGENGSGKSSIYEGLKQFFNSSEEKEIPYRNIHVSEKIFSKQKDKNVPNDVSVKITFSENKKDDTPHVLVFGTAGDKLKNEKFIKKANSLNSFFSYKELLRTYLFNNKDKKLNFKAEFARLLIEEVLGNKKNNVTNTKYSKEWNRLFTPGLWAKTKYKQLEPLIEGLISDIDKINNYLKEIIKYFDTEFYVGIKLIKSEIEYRYTEKKEKEMLKPVLEVDLIVKHNGFEIKSKNQNHLLILNEAKLSAIAISFYLSVLVHFSKKENPYQILFLDDIFIGLDMSNRLPLLRILQEYIKPGSEKKEPFFKNFQIFITTYDKAWFEISKKKLNEKFWHSIEIYAGKHQNNKKIHKPIIIQSTTNLERAFKHFEAFDYPAAGNYLRKACESIIKNKFIESKNKVYLINSSGKCKNNLQDLFNTLLKYYKDYNSQKQLPINFENNFNTVKDAIMNPSSHDDLRSELYKKEIEYAFEFVEELKGIEFPKKK